MTSPGWKSAEGGTEGVLLVIALVLAVFVATVLLPLASVATGLRFNGVLRAPAGREGSAGGSVSGLLLVLLVPCCCGESRKQNARHRLITFNRIQCVYSPCCVLSPAAHCCQWDRMLPCQSPLGIDWPSIVLLGLFCALSSHSIK